MRPLVLFSCLLIGYFTGILHFQLSNDELTTTITSELKKEPEDSLVKEKIVSEFTNQTSIPIFIRESLFKYSVIPEELTKKEWRKFLEYSAYDKMIKQTSLELMVYFSLISDNENMLGFTLDQGANADAIMRVRSYSHPLKYAALYSTVSVFKKIVDASDDLNKKDYRNIVKTIHKSAQPDDVKEAKLEYLLSSGHVISDLLNQVIPLAAYDTLLQEYFSGDDLINLDPNKMVGKNILLTRLIINGAPDDLVESLAYQLKPSLNQNLKATLMLTAIRSKSIRKAETIEAILQAGIDPNMELEDRRYSFAGQALIEAIVTQDADAYEALLVKLKVLVNKGGSILSKQVTRNEFILELKEQRGMNKVRYDELLGLIQGAP